MVQWLGLGAFTAKVPGSIPGSGTKIPRAVGQLSPCALEPERRNNWARAPQLRPNVAK